MDEVQSTAAEPAEDKGLVVPRRPIAVVKSLQRVPVAVGDVLNAPVPALRNLGVCIDDDDDDDVSTKIPPTSSLSSDRVRTDLVVVSLH